MNATAIQEVDPQAIHASLEDKSNAKVAELLFMAVTHAHELAGDGPSGMSISLTIVKCCLTEVVARDLTQDEWVEGIRASNVFDEAVTT